MATILIVDDHVLNRAFLMTLLGYGKHHLLEAADGVEALHVLESARPDLVISDIRMPNMDGHEFVMRLRADSRLATIPVIFYTAAYHESEAKVIARACGVSRILLKPAEPETILEAVDAALGVQSPLVELPPLTAPPLEGNRFSTIDSQLSEYMVEIERSQNLIAQMVAQPAPTGKAGTDRDALKKRLDASLSSLKAAGARMTALVEVSKEVAAEAAAAQDDVDAESIAGAQTLKERQSFQARLSGALKDCGYPHDSPTQLAREFNVRFPGRPITIHAARKWLVAGAIPTQDKLRVLAQWLGVTAEWLRFGDPDETGNSPRLHALATISAEDGQLLETLGTLDPYDRRIAHDFIHMLADKKDRTDRQPSQRVQAARDGGARVAPLAQEATRDAWMLR